MRLVLAFYGATAIAAVLLGNFVIAALCPVIVLLVWWMARHPPR